MISITKTVAACLLGALSTFTFAHEKHDHAKKAGPAKKEQKAWGIAGDARQVTRTIGISMSDNMRFTPERVAVQQGDTIKFVVKNNGKVLHEYVIGTKKELDEHAALMVKFPTMEHDEPYMAHVQPGKTGEIIWHFNRAGDFDFACLIAGHYQSGMVGKITVAAASAKAESHGGHKH